MLEAACHNAASCVRRTATDAQAQSAPANLARGPDCQLGCSARTALGQLLLLLLERALPEAKKRTVQSERPITSLSKFATRDALCLLNAPHRRTGVEQERTQLRL
jgi:hypothetical protein